MNSLPYLRITMPNLSQQAAYELVCWLEGLTHGVSLYYSDEIRSELQQRDDEAQESFDDTTIPF